MSFLFFNENKRDTKNRFVMFLVGLAFFIFGIRYTQIDITTSAMFFDDLGLQVVLDARVNGGQSVEAWMFGISLSLLQVYLGYRAVMSEGKNQRIAWFTGMLIVAAFDTYTDADFRSYGLTMDNYLAIKSVLVSLFVYNLFSEWAVGVGFREVVNNLDTVAALIGEILQASGIAQAIQNVKYKRGFTNQSIGDKLPTGNTQYQQGRYRKAQQQKKQTTNYRRTQKKK